MNMRSGAKAACLCLGVVLALQAQPAFAESKIGVAAAVQNQVFGNSQPLANGSSVFANERIRTGDASSAQLQFIDETNLAIGPKSELVLDRFVYNPNRGKGNVVLETGRGAFRFVSGSQDPTSYQIKTPVATIGVRGTVFYLINTSGASAIVQVEHNTIVKILATGQNIILPPGSTLLIYNNGNFEIFQSIDALHSTTAHLDPKLINEFQELLLNTTFLSTLNNTFRCSHNRCD